MRNMKTERTYDVTNGLIRQLKLKGKPKCPVCSRPLTFIYEGSKGFSGEKCSRCRKDYIVNTETLEVLRITHAS